MDESQLRQMQFADLEVENGDYVVLDRSFRGDLIEEHIITFSDCEIRRILHADDAPTFKKGKRDS